MKTILYFLLPLFTLSTIALGEESATAVNSSKSEASTTENKSASESDAEKEEETSPPEEKTPEEKEKDALQEEIDRLKKENEKLSLENEITQQKLKRELTDLFTEKEKIEAENAIRRAKFQKSIADLAEKSERTQHENSLKAAELEVRINALSLKEAEMRNQQMGLEFEVAELNSTLAKRKAEDQWENFVDKKPEYLTEPLVDGDLVISDRRITLEGPIGMETADHIVERINYFNNKSEKYPIFIVIETSPGGSVMAGYKILKAMSGSQAPVYVVVKSFAASMAAAIVTLAEKSYAYPNAIILHHQLGYGSFGNMTVHKEMLEEAQQWWKRLAAPIAQKMGITLEEFIEKMYANNSEGDWREFADKAKKLQWVDVIVTDIRETSLLVNPDAESQSKKPQQRHYGEKIDGEGKVYVPLPRLTPFDFYYLYNPDGYYRMVR